MAAATDQADRLAPDEGTEQVARLPAGKFSRPHEAVALYQGVLRDEPEQTEIELSLMYAQLEAEDFAAARRTLDAAIAHSPAWTRAPGPAQPLRPARTKTPRLKFGAVPVARRVSRSTNPSSRYRYYGERHGCCWLSHSGPW